MRATDPIPRSDMTPDQKRRIGALQVAQATYGRPSTSEHILNLIRLAKYIETGE